MHGPELAPHQYKAMGEMSNGCVLKGGVGTGKSRTAIAYFYSEVCGGGWDDEGRLVRPAQPRDLYIFTTAKKRDEVDWEKEVAPFGLSKEREVSLGNIEVHIDSWNNITKYTEVENAFIIFDEQRLVGSGAWVKAFLSLAGRNQWIVLSATPGDTWMDYCPIFVAHGFYKNRTEFKREHVVYNNFSKFPRIDHYIGEARLREYRRRLIVDMPYERHTIRHPRPVEPSFDRELFDTVWKRRWNPVEGRPVRDVAELYSLARRVVNSDPSRLAALNYILQQHKRVILFYNFNYERDIIREWAESNGVVLHEWSGHRHEAVPDGEGPWVYLVQYTAGAEGWNCITTDCVAFWSQCYSYKQFEQAHGRIDRLNTPYRDLFYYYFVSDSEIDKRIAKAMEKKESFNEIKDSMKRSVEVATN